MWSSVEEAFRPWIKGEKATGEGEFMYMHKCRNGWVTIGIGNKIQDKRSDSTLPENSPWCDPQLYKYKANAPIEIKKQHITKRTIQKDYEAVYRLDRPSYAQCRAVTMLDLTKEGLNRMFVATLHSFEDKLKKMEPYSLFDVWPADAQMGLLGLAWGTGCGGTRKVAKGKFSESCRVWDFQTAAKLCQQYGDDIVTAAKTQRKMDLKIMFNNAAYVVYRIISQGSSPTGWFLAIPIEACQLRFERILNAPQGWKPNPDWYRTAVQTVRLGPPL